MAHATTISNPLLRQISPPEAKDSFYAGFSPSTQVLQKGHKRYSRSRPFPVATVWERDVPIPMRDGTILRADIFRPENTESVPAILVWSPYGKSGAGAARLDMIPAHVGIPYDWLSDYEKFEGPDPAEWARRGYAVVNMDARGSWDSEGNLIWFGTKEGKDGYDAVEHLAKLPWCNGSVCMAGNSWLAIAQWCTAAEQPPSLKCIAPFEGASDIYREIICRGGIPYTAFFQFIAETLRGRNQQEDISGMIGKYPLMNEYWADKRVAADRIKIPAYVVASYSTCLHTPGTLRAYEDITHENKWLRIHDTQEWHDLYQPTNNDELQRFYDRFTKGIDNGWENTPKVRVALLGFNEGNIANHVVKDWPVSETRHLKLFLSDNGQLLTQAPQQPNSLSYRSDAPSLQQDQDAEELHFKHTFKNRSYMLGSSKAVLYMSCNDFDDMDVCTQIRKADRDSNILWSYNVPFGDLARMGMDKDQVPVVNPMIYLGPTGNLRASHRALDKELTKPHWPVHDHRSEERIKPREVVKLEIGLWPAGIIFDEGESLIFKISGHWMTLAEFPHLRGDFKSINKGEHHVHVGGQTDSHIILPFIDL